MIMNDKVKYPAQVQRWGMFELTVQGPDAGNPYVDQSVDAVFSCAGEKVQVKGFYDGDGVYKVRFMPSFEGEYTFSLTASFALQASGQFVVTKASTGNHGPVRVANTWHFAYEDGTPY